LEVSIIRATKINKVLKAILKLEEIPKESEFNFKDRSQVLLTKWNKILESEAVPTTSESGAVTAPTTNGSAPKELENGVSAKPEAKEPDTTEPETKGEETAAAPVDADATKEEVHEEDVPADAPAQAAETVKPTEPEAVVEAAS